MSSSENPSACGPMTPEEAAAFWLVHRDKGVVLNDDPDFLEWLAASPDHVRAWNNATSLWTSFDDGSDALLDAMRRDALTARREADHTWKWGMIAAGLAVMLISGAVVWRIYGV